MLVYEKQALIPKSTVRDGLLTHIATEALRQIPDDELPLRFAVTKQDSRYWHCELAVLGEYAMAHVPDRRHVFEYRSRNFESASDFCAVLIIPTGIDAEIGGDSGDAGPVAKLLASACDTLITHPNVVNASDINELPENGLYVEGSVLTRLLMGSISLQQVRSNRILMIIDKHDDPFFNEAAVNSVSAARAALGIDCPEVVMMEDKISMQSLYSPSGRAVGSVQGLERLCNVLDSHAGSYDAVALSSVIGVPHEYHLDYFRKEMINPWGGVEAMLTHAISSIYNVQSAHSPMMESKDILNLEVGIVDPLKAAEAVSTTFLHCILKGLHKSPRIVYHPYSGPDRGLITVEDVSCLVIPDGCIGLPTLAAIEQGIPVIAVRENRNRMMNDLTDLPFDSSQLHVVDNYLEAVGVISAIRAGVTPSSVRRPFEATQVAHASAEPKLGSDNPTALERPAGTDDSDICSAVE